MIEQQGNVRNVTEFTETVSLRDRKINFRKWKVKDRTLYKQALEQGDNILKRQALVYNCLENPETPLDNEEANYLLLCIRAKSLKEPIRYTFKCPVCGEIFDTEVDLKLILNIESKPYGVIKTDQYSIAMQGIRNKGFYEKSMNETKDPYNKYLLDFCLHVKSLNNNDTLTLDTLMTFINELDVDVFEEIFKQWEDMRFKIDMSTDITCPHCESVIPLILDDLPSFFPDSWRIA